MPNKLTPEERGNKLAIEIYKRINGGAYYDPCAGLEIKSIAGIIAQAIREAVEEQIRLDAGIALNYGTGNALEVDIQEAILAQIPTPAVSPVVAEPVKSCANCSQVRDGVAGKRCIEPGIKFLDDAFDEGRICGMWKPRPTKAGGNE